MEDAWYRRLLAVELFPESPKDRSSAIQTQDNHYKNQEESYHSFFFSNQSVSQSINVLL